jgi:hypothetical protein
MADHYRAIDKWMKYVAIFGPMVSGIVFGGVGYAKGFYDAKDQITIVGTRITSIENWKERQDEFNIKTVSAIARLKALMKDMQP